MTYNRFLKLKVLVFISTVISSCDKSGIHDHILNEKNEKSIDWTNEKIDFLARDSISLYYDKTVQIADKYSEQEYSEEEAVALIFNDSYFDTLANSINKNFHTIISGENVKSVILDIFHNPSKYFDLSKTQVKISPLQESPSEKKIINYVQKTLEHIIHNAVYALFQDIGLNLEGIRKQQDKKKKYPELLIEKRIGCCRNAARYAISILEKNGIWAKTLTIQEKYDFTRHDCVLFKSKEDSKFYIWDVTYYMIGQSGPNGAYHQLLRTFQKGNSDFCDYLEKTIEISHNINQKIAKYYHNKEVDTSSDEYKDMFKFLNNNGYKDIFEFLNCKEKLLQKVCENPIIDFQELPKLYHTGTCFWLDIYENPEPLDLISLREKISSIK